MHRCSTPLELFAVLDHAHKPIAFGGNSLTDRLHFILERYLQFREMIDRQG
jgi:actin-related protein